MKLLYLFFILINAKNSILFSGLENWNDDQLSIQYNLYKSYKHMNLITGSSILLYNIGSDGLIKYYNTSPIASISSHEFQVKLKTNLGLKAYPTFFCDTSIGKCTSSEFPLSYRLNKLLENKNTFIKLTINEALHYDWDGYYLDFEPTEVIDNYDIITDFIFEWNDALNKINRTLNIWTGGSSIFNENRIFNNSNIYLTTMSTYDSYYTEFVNVANNYFSKISNLSKFSFGLLTYTNNLEFANETIIQDICNWIKLTRVYSIALWASTIPPMWFRGLQNYLV